MEIERGSCKSASLGGAVVMRGVWAVMVCPWYGFGFVSDSMFQMRRNKVDEDDMDAIVQSVCGGPGEGVHRWGGSGLPTSDSVEHPDSTCNTTAPLHSKSPFSLSFPSLRPYSCPLMRKCGSKRPFWAPADAASLPKVNLRLEGTEGHINPYTSPRGHSETTEFLRTQLYRGIFFSHYKISLSVSVSAMHLPVCCLAATQ